MFWPWGTFTGLNKQWIHAQMGLTKDNIKVMARKAQGYNQITCLSVCIHEVKLPENLRKVRVIKTYLNIAHDDKCVWLFMHSPC